MTSAAAGYFKSRLDKNEESLLYSVKELHWLIEIDQLKKSRSNLDDLKNSGLWAGTVISDVEYKIALASDVKYVKMRGAVLESAWNRKNSKNLT